MISTRQLGFTLIEVLVALAVIAVALAAGVQASGALLTNTERQRESLLAQLCIENAFTELRLKSMTGAGRPAAGEQTFECPQAGLTYTVIVNVSGTPNPNIVRLDAAVKNATEGQIMTLSSVLGPP
jgi:general secretion pathway protein I